MHSAAKDALASAVSRVLASAVDIQLRSVTKMVCDSIKPHFESTSHPYADYLTIQDSHTPGAEQMAAIQRLAAVLEGQWRLRDDQVRLALVRRAHTESRSVQAVKHSELMAAIPLVLRHDMEQPQFVKSGAEWWCDNGRKVLVRPTELPMDYAFDWVDRRIMAVAEASILDMSLEEYQAYRNRRAAARKKPRSRGVQSDQSPFEPLSLHRFERADMLDRLADDDADPLHMLIEREELQQEQATQAELWERLWAYATPAQKRLLHAWLQQLQRGGTVREAAAALGISDKTAYAQVYRLRGALTGQKAL
jgi:hypothetical protein